MVCTEPNQTLLNRIARLSPAQRALLERRRPGLRMPAAQAGERIPSTGHAGDAPFALTSVQRRVWAFEQLCPDTAVYNVVWVKTLRGSISITALEQALQALAERHAALRTTFHSTDAGPVQRVADTARFPLERHTVPQSGARELLLRLAARPFDLSEGPLLRAALIATGPGEHWLLLVVHHLVTDGWSMGILERDLAACYNAFLESRDPPVYENRISYTDFAAWRAGRSEGAEYWMRELVDAPPLLALPCDFARPATFTPAACTGDLAVDGALLAQLERAARLNGVTLYVLLISAWAALLHRYGSGDEVVIGSPLAGRTHPDLHEVAGFFANTLPLRVAMGDDPPFSALLNRVQAKVLAALEHQDAALDDVLERLKPARSPGVTPGFQTAVAYLESQAAAADWTGLAVSHVMLDNRTVPFDAMLYVDQTAQGLKASVALRAQLFRPESAARMAAHLRTLLEGIAANAGMPVTRYPLMDHGGRETVLRMSAGVERDHGNLPVHARFDAVAEAHPGRIALVRDERTMTYGALRDEAGRIAAALAARNIGPGSVVAVRCDGSIDMIAAFLGVLKAGAAYLPLDPAEPRARIEAHLQAAAAILTPGAIESPAGVSAPPAAAVTADDPAYVMFTSGSTGAPKAVKIPHRGIVRLVNDPGYARFTSSDVFLQMAPTAFDASTLEIWAPLLNGGRCVLYSGEKAGFREIGDAIRRHGVTVLWLTSSLFNAFIEESPESLCGLRLLLTGGEALSPPHVARALRALPGVEVINGYGPTESTTFASCYAVPRGFDASTPTVPIGTPISNTQIYVLGPGMQIQPPGVPGELYIGGDGVALEYWNDPEQTAQAFVPDPFRPRANRMLYRTGDRARWLPDGVLEFLGRTDQQVKIRGFRIEPGEVESALRALPGVSEAAVRLVGSGAGAKLVAWVACGSDASLPDALVGRLPDYMIPSQFVYLDRLPLTANGKLDKRALPDPGPDPTMEIRLPRDEYERDLLAMWRDLLGAPEAGLHADFFGMGGNSLLAIRLLARVEKRWGRRLPASALYSAPSVEKFAPFVRGSADPGFAVITPGAGGAPLVWLDLASSVSPLAAALGPEQPFYTLTLTADEVAALPQPPDLKCFAEAIGRKLEIRRPGGPSILASFCLRTFLAVETARWLRRHGHAVPLVVLADPSDPENAIHLLNPASPAALLPPLKTHLRKLKSLPLREVAPYVAGRGKAVIERVKMQFGRNPVLEQPIFEAGARHRMSPYDGDLLLVRCASPEEVDRDDIVRNWRPLAAGRFSIRTLPGGHTQMFEEPNASEFARAIREEIAACNFTVRGGPG